MGDGTGTSTTSQDVRTGDATAGPLRTAVVYNPVRVEGLDERRRVVEEALAAAGWPAPRWIETTEDDPGAGQARQAVADGAQVVFACGGDGTVRSCIEGLAGGPGALAVLPAGTGNLLATNLGLPDDPAAGVRVVVERGRRRIDVGYVDGQAFAVMAGIGFDAALLDDASTQLKARFGPAAYVVSALKHLRRHRIDVRIELDDRPPMRRRVRSVVVGNVGRLQGGVLLLADAEPDNGQMEVAVLAPRTLGDWAGTAWGVARRRKHVPHLETFRASHVRVVATEPHRRQLDGDVIERGRVLEVSISPAALDLCVPQPERSEDLSEGSERL
ncbi:diacylglycerol/lipid kinase family protein [Cellulomonas marina]|uniref:Diacylglycerol kinase family enzyme n=1 Tax=Cellulomonas marina TaxID=988821 RepID=A0A1I0ZY27_9CELL|nr:diacylglycerol kinase family protein [Cellulomonas marina]GIG29464.1 sphingosine kinase [Cellulomonas marina]SFB30675.1 Diacylglycerol kinase family enzyme [Cellulomonas marina]